MDPILVDAAQLRTLRLPGLALTPGRVIMARVAETGEGGRGQLAIAGGRIGASLPSGVRAGDELRLVVREISSERVVLQIQADAPPATPPADPRDVDDEGEAPGGAPGTPIHVLVLRYETQSFGSVDLRFELHAGDALSLQVGMATAAGLARARENSEDLRATLDRALAGDVAVTVTQRRPPLDLYA
jgi:hypothetical protein